MCMECCRKLFEDDRTIKKCPYCREDIVFYKMNEIIKIFKNDEEVEVDCQDRSVSNDFTNSFIRGRFIYNDYDYDDDDELSFISIPGYNFTPSTIPSSDILTQSSRPSLIEHYMALNVFISPSNERFTNIQHANLLDFIFPTSENVVVDPYTGRTRLRERRVYTNMMGRRSDHPTRSQIVNDHIHPTYRQQETRPEISNNPMRVNFTIFNDINIRSVRNSSNANTITRNIQPTNRRQNSRQEINKNNTRRNIPRHGRRR